VTRTTFFNDVSFGSFITIESIIGITDVEMRTIAVARLAMSSGCKREYQKFFSELMINGVRLSGSNPELCFHVLDVEPNPDPITKSVMSFVCSREQPSVHLFSKNRIVEILCFVGIILLLHSASRTLIVMGIGSGSYYFGLQEALAPFENIEGLAGALLAMNPLFLLVFTRS